MWCLPRVSRALYDRPSVLRTSAITHTCLALACLSACEADVEVSEAAFELHSVMGCELGSAERLEVRALGDFPARSDAFDAGAMRRNFDRFPLGTRELAVDGAFERAEVAGGRAILAAADGGEASPIVVLPEGRSCPLGDQFVVASEGAAVAPLPNGGLLIAGGQGSDGKIALSAVVLRPGRTLSEQVEDGMFLRRQHANAVLAGDKIIVSGGISEPGGSAADTYEVFDPALGVFARELNDHLSDARMEHGGAVLPDGQVLLVGGRAAPNMPPLATAELIHLEGAASDAPTDLVEARVAPEVLVLDSGAVIVAGGRDADGATVTSLERYEAAARRFVRLEGSLPAYERAVAIALPGTRIAWLGCDSDAAKRCGLTLVLLRETEPVYLDVPLDWAAYVPDGLNMLHAVALDDGRILALGRDPRGSMMSRALVIDPAEPSITAYEATRAPSALVSLTDGLIAEIDPFGTSLRRLGSSSAFEDPEGDLLVGEIPRAAIDAPDRWERRNDSFTALVSGARVDVTKLRFGDVRVELDLSGDALLRLSGEGAPDLAIGVGTRVSARGCPQLAATGSVWLERRGDAIEVRPGASSRQRCTLTWPGAGLVRLAVEAEADATLEFLRATRL